MRPGAIFEYLYLSGKEEALKPLLNQEAGGHRWQRVPPTERKGRVHTSTVTVAVFEGHSELAPKVDINPNDVHERITKGQGPGGQNRNKRETCVVLTHKPTGISVKAEVERTQEANRKQAWQTLIERVTKHYSDIWQSEKSNAKKIMVGTGQRGDKIRTYRADGVTDHRTGKKCSLTKVQQGFINLLN